MRVGVASAVVLAFATCTGAGPTVSADADGIAAGTTQNHVFAGVALTDMSDSSIVWAAEEGKATGGAHVCGEVFDDQDPSRLCARFISGLAAWMAIDISVDCPEDYRDLVVDEIAATDIATKKLDRSNTRGLQRATVSVAVDSCAPCTRVGADSVAVADDIELDGLAGGSRATIPIPWGALVGIIGACLVCGLKKCHTL